MSKYRRIFLVVCDSLGFGAMNDAPLFGDDHPDTIGHCAHAAHGLSIPTLEKLGVASLREIEGVEEHDPSAVMCLLREASAGKDTLTGHWEMMGLKTSSPFISFTDTGFPDELLSELAEATDREIIGNKAMSGTEILKELADQEVDDPRKMIVYTSADSVLQICGREDVDGGLERLYDACEKAREITLSRPEWRVARVIARPYVVNDDGTFSRTSNRKDYSVEPPDETVLDALTAAGKDVLAVGKIEDIFSGHGITESQHSTSSVEGMGQVSNIAARDDWEGLCFANLSDFDVLWGHRRNSKGYAHEIELFDDMLGFLMKQLSDDDLVIVTADHGNDPTAKGTDHTREKVPFIAWSPSMESGSILEEQPTFSVIGATIAENFGIEYDGEGQSLLARL